MTRNKMPVYFFEKTALAELAGFVDRTTLYAFDLDGTLAPIASEPQAIGIPDVVRTAFAQLALRAPVAVITGRSRVDAMLHLGVEPRYLIGNHGVEGLPGWALRERAFIRIARGWQAQLTGLIDPDEYPGIEIENKGATLSLHYRRAASISTALTAIRRATGQLAPAPVRISGKCVENLLPEGAPDKGAALGVLMRQEGFEKAFFAGDDETDEQVFRLNSGNIFSVRVGNIKRSRARFYLKGQYEVDRLLGILNATLYS